MMSHYFQLGVQLALVCLLASGMFIAARVNYLLKIGLIVRTPSGRRATPSAYRHLGHRVGEGPLQLSLE